MKQLSIMSAVLGGILLAVCQLLIFFYAPEEASLGIIQKVFYIHVPLAWWGFISYFIVCIASVLYLRTQKIYWHNIALANAEIGVLFTVFTLITGMIWGRNSWGVWWTWDPRLTTALILFFIYTGYLLIQTLEMQEEKRRKISAVLGILAFIDVPLVFFSARLWRSIHPAVFTSQGSGLTPTMLTTFLCTLGSMFFLWFALVLYRYFQLQLLHRIDIVYSKQLGEHYE